MTARRSRVDLASAFGDAPFVGVRRALHAHDANRPHDDARGEHGGDASNGNGSNGSNGDITPLWTLAVTQEGRRHEDACVADANAIGAARSAGAIVCLDHAGPRAALWASARPIGPADHPEAETGRRPRPLDDAEWEALTAAFADAAARCRAHAVPYALALDDDGLWHALLSPLASPGVFPEVRRARLVRVVAACRGTPHGRAPFGAIVPVEDLAPGGIDATEGIALARAAVEAGATTIFAAAGTARLMALKARRKGRSRGDLGASLASAAWLVGRVDAPIVAVVPASVAPRDDLARRDRRRIDVWRAGVAAAVEGFGLAGVVFDVPRSPSTPSGLPDDVVDEDPGDESIVHEEAP